MRFKSFAILMALTAIFAFSQPLSASVWFNRPIEEIAGDADVIVIARPLIDQVQIPKTEIRGGLYNKPGRPGSFPFVVTQVLFGQHMRPDQLILIENAGSEHLIKLFRGIQFQAEHSTEMPDDANRPTIEKTLLFLSSDLYHRDSQADYQLVYDGIRILTQDGQTFVPGHWGTFDKLQQPQNALWGEGDFQDSVRRLSESNPTIQLRRRLRRMCDYGPAAFCSKSADLQVWHSPEQTVFGIPILSQNIGEPSDPQEDLPPVEPQTDQP